MLIGKVRSMSKNCPALKRVVAKKLITFFTFGSVENIFSYSFLAIYCHLHVYRRPAGSHPLAGVLVYRVWGGCLQRLELWGWGALVWVLVLDV
jgi:hypothetical protein